MIRNNVSFYEVCNGHSSYFGEGKEITLNNGSCYAIIKEKKYLVQFDGYNNQSILPL